MVNEECANECYFTDCPDQCNDDMWTCDGQYCVHKDLTPFTIDDFTTSIAVVLVTTLASIAGIGGGGLLLPVYLLLGKFGTDYSIPLTVFTIAGSSLARMLILLPKKHPNTYRRYLIDYRAILLIVPFDGNTSFVGMILNAISPKWLVLLAILMILSTVSYKTLKKGHLLFKEESLEIAKQKDPNYTAPDIVIIDGIDIPIKKTTLVIDNIDVEIAEEEYNKVMANVREDRPNDRWGNLAILCTTFGCLVIFSVTRDQLDTCSAGYWVQYVGQFIFFILIGSYLGIRNIQAYQIEKDNYEKLIGDVEWDKEKVIKYAIISSATGIISTYMGIGGGMLIAPFLLQIGILPEVAAATNSVTTFFSSMATSLQYLMSGRLLLGYSLYYFALSMVSSYFGLKLSSKIIRRFQRRSFIILTLGILVLFSCIMLLAIGVNDLIEDIDNKEDMGFNDFCEVRE